MNGRETGALTCQELVELVTDYLEGRLDAAARGRFDQHMAECAACVLYIEQMRQTITALGHIPPETVSREAEEELLAAFRHWRESTA